MKKQLEDELIALLSSLVPNINGPELRLRIDMVLAGYEVTKGKQELEIYKGDLNENMLKRFLAVFFPAAEYRVTTRMTEVQGHRFRTDGKVLVNPGWLAVYGKEAQDEDANLVPVGDGETVTIACDTVLNAAGFRANNSLEEACLAVCDDVAVVGDAVGPRKILDAIHEGYHAIRVME